MSLAEYVKNKRKARKVSKPLSLTDVAIESGIPYQTLWAIENGTTTNPTIETLKMLSVYFEVPIKELIAIVYEL